jgi:hypothetical protein
MVFIPKPALRRPVDNSFATGISISGCAGGERRYWIIFLHMMVSTSGGHEKGNSIEGTRATMKTYERISGWLRKCLYKR